MGWDPGSKPPPQAPVELDVIIDSAASAWRIFCGDGLSTCPSVHLYPAGRLLVGLVTSYVHVPNVQGHLRSVKPSYGGRIMTNTWKECETRRPEQLSPDGGKLPLSNNQTKQRELNIKALVSLVFTRWYTSLHSRQTCAPRNQKHGHNITG